MRKICTSLGFLLLLFSIALPAPVSVRAFTKMNERVYDDFNRPALGVTEPGNTGAGVEPDDTWVHNPDGFVVYWIQYNATTKASITDGVLKFQSNGEDGWLGFGMTGDYKDRNYDSFSVKIKGEKGGEEAGLYFNIAGVFDFHWDNARDPDGNPLPKITTNWQTITISLANSGMGATKAQRNMMAGGWTDFHINSHGGPLTVYIDEIKQVQTHAYREPTAPATSAAPTTEPAAPPESAAPQVEPTEPVGPTVGGDAIYPATDRPLDNSFLVDDFNRASLLLDPEMEVPPGGEFGRPNTDGGIIYWIQFNEATQPTIENGALKLTTTGAGWYGTATDMAFLDEYNCVAFRVKGAKGGEEQLLTFNPDTQGAKTFAELVAPDGKPLPPITTEWQTLVVDLVQSGWKGLADGKESYQNIHLNTTGALTVYIDEIYFTAVNLTPPTEAEAPPEIEPAPPVTAAAPVAEAPEPWPTAAVPQPAERDNTGRLAVVIAASAVIVGAIAGAVVLLTRKPKS